MGIAFYNNWLGYKEFNLIDIELMYKDDCMTLVLGIIGFGIVIAVAWR